MNDQRDEIEARLAAAQQEGRFYGPYSALKDIGWLVSEVDRQRGLLTRLEWACLRADLSDEPSCPACYHTRTDGHDPGCWLAAALSTGGGDST
jgi:hypothetical protein